MNELEKPLEIQLNETLDGFDGKENKILNADECVAESIDLNIDFVTSDILKRLKEGSKDAFQAVYLQWRKPVYLLLLKLTGSKADAEDISQDVFVKLWENHEKIDPAKNIKSLLYLIARQSAFNHFDRKKTRKSYSSNATANGNSVDYESASDIIVAKEIELLKQITLSRMSEQRRKMYIMSVDENRGAAEIAQKLKVSKETVYNQISAAKKELRDIIAILLLFCTIS